MKAFIAPLASIAAFASALALVLAAAPPARADGDPASDVLLAQSVFFPYSPPVSQSLQNTLTAETAAASRAHFPIKVALIDSPQDLGAIPVLFGKPRQYAAFLDQEISFEHKQPLLVVMPNGYGVQGLGAGSAAAVASLARPAGRRSDDLARAAVTAVQALAVAAGHPIEVRESPPSTAGNGRGSTPLALIVLGVAAVGLAGALIALRARERPAARVRPARGAYARSRRRRRPRAGRRGSPALYTFTYGPRGGVVQPRLVVGLVLISGGAFWAVARGLDFYGLSLAGVGYDLDQPPLLLLLVGAWLVYRSRRR